MPQMFSDDDLDVMQLVRDAFDPQRLCNPGKVLPTPRLCGEVPGPYRAASRRSRPGSPSASDDRWRRRFDAARRTSRPTPSMASTPRDDRRSPTTPSRSGRGARVARRASGCSPSSAAAAPSSDGVGTPSARRSRAVSTARLNALLVHRHGDLTATVQAGVTLAAAQSTAGAARAVAAGRQRVRRRDHRRHRRHQRHRPAAPPLRHAARSADRHHAGADRRPAGRSRADTW